MIAIAFFLVKNLLWISNEKIRKSHRRCTVKNFVLKNVSIFTPVLKTLFNKIAGLSKRLQYSRYFPINIATFLITPILKNICDRLLLKSITSFLVSSLKPLNTYFCQLTFFVIKLHSKAFPVPYFRLTCSR